jgi:signal transduction histidine kinase
MSPSNPIFRSPFLQKMMISLPCGVALVRHGKIILNPVAEKIVGYETAEFATLDDWFEKVYKKNADEVRAIHAEQRRQGFPERTTFQLLRKDGVVRHVSFSGFVDGGVEVWILFDESDSVETHRLLEETKERTAMILSENKIGTYRIDSQSKDYYWDERVFELYQLPPCAPSEILTKWIEIVHSEDGLRMAAQLQECMRTGNEFNARYRITWPNGEVRHMRTQGKVQCLAGGQHFVITGIVIDITEGVRTYELLQEHQARLLHAEKMATLGEMSSGIAHEINNQLAVIRARAEQMAGLIERREFEDGRMSQALMAVERMCDRITKIIKGLRVFARDGERDPFAKVSLRKVVEETLEFCREKFKFHQVELRVRCDLEFPEVIGRQVQLEQVLLNLLSNSYDAVQAQKSPSEKWIEVALTEYDDTWEISIIDSGPGIPGKVAERIMEPFFTTKEVGKGSGLGLSISSGIISEHGGTLQLDRDFPNTRFVIRLPRIFKRSQVA